MRTCTAALFMLAFLFVATALPAAEPLGHVNYQGVLRGADDKPKDGTFDMTFAFYGSEDATETILTDDHLAAYGNAVVVSGGLFNVALGSGLVADGSGPGIYASLPEAFRDYGAVFMAVSVNGETLSPRVPVLAAAYAANAHSLDGIEAAGFAPSVHTHAGSDISGPVSDSDMLDGRHASGFLDTSTTAQTKSGPLTVDAGTVAASTGVWAKGVWEGGYFRDSPGNSADLGWNGFGVVGKGSYAGGAFQDLDGNGQATLGTGEVGVSASGTPAGDFTARAGTGYASVASGNIGIEARGSDVGGLFRDSDSSGSARLADGDTGVAGSGQTQGGYFEDTDGTGRSWVGYGDYGIQGQGGTAGGMFTSPTSWVDWAEVGKPGYKIQGAGTVSFVQNDPTRDDRVVVYAAPEGDEVAVYTRGTARLAGGEARVALGDTFRLVANPDLGLTAYVTPVGAWSDLYVVSTSTEELVVRSRPGSPDVTFHYVVWGLRLGFEELAILQPKERDGLPPAPEAIAGSYGARPELRAHNARERYLGMRRALGQGEPDLSHASALLAALENQRSAARQRAGATRPPHVVTASPVEEVPPAAPPALAAHLGMLPPDPNLFPVTGPVESGDVLSLDPVTPGALRRAASPADPAVVGIAAGAAVDEEGELRVALVETNVAVVKADATPGAIVPGDLLVSSPLAGYAMRSAAPAPGTVLGKALESLEAGTGTIRILVIPR